MADISDEISALPDRLRRYIHHIETDADPAGTVRENFHLREENARLRDECDRLARSHGGSIAVEQWDAADLHVEEVLARCSNAIIGQAAFKAAVEIRPHQRLYLRDRTRVVMKHEPNGV